MSKTPMTHFGAEALREELDRLKRIERPRIIEAIATARAHGDLKENAEYHAAREEQGFTEGRIMDIESKLGNAQIIDVRKLENTGRVIFGVTVTLQDLDTEVTHRWTIVGEDEANVSQGKISVSAPLSRAMIGKEAGDVVTVSAPKGDTEYEILKVEYL